MGGITTTGPGRGQDSRQQALGNSWFSAGKSPGINPKVSRYAGYIADRYGPGPFKVREKGVNTARLPHDGNTGSRSDR